MTATETLRPGFADPVDDSQRTFRRLLEAMSQPGRMVDLDRAAGPPPLHAATTALALTLLDGDTPVWLGESFRSRAVEAYLKFHCGCPILDTPEGAAFAFGDCTDAPMLSLFDLGSEEYPDRSTTMVLQVPSLDSGERFTLRGPGIATTEAIVVGGIGAGFWSERARLATMFPRGLDLVLACGSRIVALPRTTEMEKA
jgi:alpha-D-ribose 1-methylphosphonate 5-triphosphate synthase subunit PhnH